MAPTSDQLAHRVELLDEMARGLSLDEVAEILGPEYLNYLRDTCYKYAKSNFFSFQPKNPALALPYANALVLACPDEDEGREMRAYCLAQLTPLDYNALLADYEWLARRPLRGRAYWAYALRDVDNEPAHNAYLVDQCTNEDLYRRTHFCLASAWACYHLNDLARAAEAFGRAFREPARDDFGFDPEWPVNMLPPVPDTGYLSWQINQHMRDGKWKTSSEAVQDWLGLALRAIDELQK